MSTTIARTVADAIDAMVAGARPIAGGSDLMVALRQDVGVAPRLVAIDRIDALGRIEIADGGLRIGAAVTHAALLDDPAIHRDYTALADAAALIGSPATRNVGTIGGNIMNASPAADTSAPLVVLDAQVELAGPDGTRRLAIASLWTGPGATVAGHHELCTGIDLPQPGAGSGSAYLRLEYRRAMEIAVAGAAASVSIAQGVVSRVSVALSAVGPTILVVPGLDDLAGRPVAEVLDQVGELARETATPISDLRAGADYRRHVIGVMAKRAVQGAADRATGADIAVPLNRAQGVGR